MRFSLHAILLFVGLISSAAHAQDRCRYPEPGQCGFYRSCIESHYQCGGDGYPVKYGEKYCERFKALGSSDLTDKGLRWRDGTLLCLQRALSELLFTSNEVNTCSDLRTFAFESHAGCYTQPGNSICDLSRSEMVTIGSTVDIGDIMTIDGISQITKVMRTCLPYLRAQVGALKGLEAGNQETNARSRFSARATMDPVKVQAQIDELEEKIRYINELK